MPDLTDDDYDALYVVVKEEMPRISREIFPKILEQLVGTGVIVIIVTDADITLSTPAAPKTGVYRVERKRRLH
jgi:hypothetical protein